MDGAVGSIREAATAACAAGAVSHDVATAINELLKLEGNEAMLACRLLGGGADPASLAYLRDGCVSPKIEAAHRSGPGVFSLADPERAVYLALCAVSADEAVDSDLRGRVLKFAESLSALGALGAMWSGGRMVEAAAAVERGFLSLRYAVIPLDGALVRLYASDGGHAAAAWDRGAPQSRSAVYGVFNGEPYVALGAPPYKETLWEQGFDPTRAEKHLSDRFWIYTDAEIVASSRFALEDVGLLEAEATA